MKTSFIILLIAGAAVAFQACSGDKTNEPGHMSMDNNHDHMNMDMDDHASPTGSVFHMRLTMLPEKITPAQPVTLSLTPEDSTKPGTPIALDVVHEKKIHLIVVSKDLSWFEHIHPELNANGKYEVSTTFPAGGDYILFADYKPSGASGQLERIPVTVEGKAAEQKNYTQQNPDWKGDDGYEVKMSFGDMPAKSGAMLMPTVTITKNGKPVSDLDNYLGALGHMVIISSDTKPYLHVHPMEDNTHGPSIMFHTQFSHPGFYRAFLQFNHGGKIHTADFVIEAK